MKHKVDVRIIYKTRYEEQANSYKIPDWLGEDISNQKRVKNGYMAIIAKDIKEYEDLIVKYH